MLDLTLASLQTWYFCCIIVVTDSRVRINFSQLYREKLHDKNLFILVSPKGPHPVDC